MAQRLNPAARDAAVRRITMVTTGVVALGLAGTVGLGVTIASATPVKNKSKPATVGTVPAPQGKVTVPQNKVGVPPATNGTAPKGTPQQQGKPAAPAPAPKPQPTTQAPETSSGGS